MPIHVAELGWRAGADVVRTFVLQALRIMLGATREGCHAGLAGGGIPFFVTNVNEEANLGAFLCTLHYSEGGRCGL